MSGEQRDLTPAARRQTGSAFRLRFRPDEPVSEGVRRILTMLTDEMLSYLDPPAEGSHEIAIHEVRRRGKQARAVLRLTRNGLGSQFKVLNRRYRNAGRVLADARDARVILEVVRDLADNADIPSSVIDELEDRALSAEAGVFSEGSPGAAKAARQLRRATAVVRELDFSDDPAVLVEGSTGTYAAGAEAYRDVRRGGSAEEFHTWRKRVKDHRHHMAYLWDADPLDPAEHDTLYRLSDLLGDAHDLIVVGEALGSLSGVPDRSLVAIDERRIALEAEAVTVGASAYVRAPEAYGVDLSRRVLGWRDAAGVQP